MGGQLKRAPKDFCEGYRKRSRRFHLFLLMKVVVVVVNMSAATAKRIDPQSSYSLIGLVHHVVRISSSIVMNGKGEECKERRLRWKEKRGPGLQ